MKKKAINELICFNIFIPGWNGLNEENLFLCIYASVCVWVYVFWIEI